MAPRPASPATFVTASNALHALAHQHGLQTHYHDMSSRVVHASPESLLATLRAFGVNVHRPEDCPEALRVARVAGIARALPPVVVAWNGRLPILSLLKSTDGSGGKFHVEIQLEHGEVRHSDAIVTPRPRSATASRESDSIHVRSPERLPMGYHRIAVHQGSQTFRSLVLSAPRRAYTEPGAMRSWGFFAPLYAMRSETNWGAGDFTDLARFSQWLSHQGGDVAGTLPLLPLFLDQPFEPSPYSPITRLFWNEFYLDLERIPELRGCTAARKQIASTAVRGCIAALRASDRVEYRVLASLKRTMLEMLARHFFDRVTPRHRVFLKFCEDHPEVETYAAFRAVQETYGADWSQWSSRVRPGTRQWETIDPARRQYHLYAQWLAHEQMADAVRTARAHGVRLYLDLPLGVHPAGYDAWRFRKVFTQGAIGGAPPDPVFTRGQSWGFAPLHPEALREEGYGYLRACLRHHLGSAGMLRFDHVMSLHRLYWIPVGMTADRGVYVRYPAEELYAVLSIESHRHRAVIVGENLGTVPPIVNRSLARHGVRGMHVTQYELGGRPRKALPSPPASCVASLNTHDMPPFAAFWRGLDIRERFRLGLLDRIGLNSEHAGRNKVRRILARQLRVASDAREPGPGEILRALWAHLSEGPAEVVLANLEDMWLESRSQNVPGTSAERGNWRNKHRFAMAQWDRLRSMRLALAALKRQRNKENYNLSS